MIWPHIHFTLDGFYHFVGYTVVGWVANNVVDYIKHSFWLGFKATFVATLKKGSALTPAENDAIKKRVYAQLNAEWQQKVSKLAVVLDENPAPPAA